ncbi:hypothetical protein PF005_g2359 [Phytophthora fragariae]|uniref:Uncharacterized protein n=1 Tax=Phytophthora fragariae TaxID=53985 RepID=A0A6A3ZAS3_9STRA|nr:hypothetical protein PF005_g2359 [Phytophthora fragariae]
MCWLLATASITRFGELLCLLEPFGLEASGQVYELRVKVAVKVVQMLDNREMESDFEMDSISVGDLVAMPGQYLQCSGVIPITAMARLLNAILLCCQQMAFSMFTHLAARPASRLVLLQRRWITLRRLAGSTSCSGCTLMKTQWDVQQPPWTMLPRAVKSPSWSGFIITAPKAAHHVASTKRQ